MPSDGRFKEMAHRHEVITQCLKFGYNAFLPLIDQGIDFILHRESDNRTLKVQLKSRWSIGEKYRGRDIWMAFPDQGKWYLAPHDEMIKMADSLGYTKSRSWIDGGAYSKPVLSIELAALLSDFTLQQIVKGA